MAPLIGLKTKPDPFLPRSRHQCLKAILWDSEFGKEKHPFWRSVWIEFMRLYTGDQFFGRGSNCPSLSLILVSVPSEPIRETISPFNADPINREAI